MSLSRAIALAGAYEHPTRWAPDKTEFQIMAECARGALDDCGLGLRDVDGLFAASMAMGPMGVVSLSEYLNIKPRHLDGTNIGKGDATYKQYNGFCLEAQKFPDSINRPEWKEKSNVILKPGETYKQTTIYKFDVAK